MELTLPAFLLKGVNSKQVLEDYLNGQYSDKTITYDPDKPFPDKIYDTARKNQISLGSDHKTSAIYIRKTPQAIYEVYTTNSNEYTSAVTSKSPQSEIVPNLSPSHGYCVWCRRKLDSDNTFPTPIPIKMTLISENVRYFHGTGHLYCLDSCAVAMLDVLLQDRTNSTLYSESRSLLGHLHYLLTGNSILIPSPHWSLLESNGGSMPADTYYNTKTKYYRNPNVIFSPIKLQYESRISNM